MNAELLKTLNEGVDLFWNFQLNEAADLFSKHADQDPTFGWFLGQVHFMTAVITENNDDAKRAFETLTKSHRLAKQKLQAAQKGTDEACLYKTILADTNLLDASLKFKLQRMVKGVYKFRKSWKWFESAERTLKTVDSSSPLHPHLTSAIYAGVGFFHYIVSIVPRAFRWLVEGIGFTGDREKGLQELLIAGETKGFGTPIGLLHLTWINAFFIEDQEQAEKWIKEALVTYPMSAPFHYLAGYVYRRFGLFDQAEMEFLNTQVFAKEVPLMQRFADYELGYSAWLNLDFEKAKEVFETFLAENPPDAFKVYGTFQLGYCYDRLGQPKEAAAKFKQLQSWVRKDYDYDSFSATRAKRYLAKGKFTDFEVKFFNCQLRYEAWAFKDCLDLLMEMAPCIQTDSQKALHTWLRGSCLAHLNDAAQAKACFETVVRMGSSKVGKDGLQALAGSYVGLAEIFIKENNFAEAEKNLRKAKDLTGYEFSQLLGWKIKRLLDRCNKAKKENK